MDSELKKRIVDAFLAGWRDAVVHARAVAPSAEHERMVRAAFVAGHRTGRSWDTPSGPKEPSGTLIRDLAHLSRIQQDTGPPLEDAERVQIQTDAFVAGVSALPFGVERSEAEQRSDVPARGCRVSYTDSEGVHSVEVTAGTLFEAVARAIVEFKQDSAVSNAPGPETDFTVVVLGKPVEHLIRLKRVQEWAECSPQSGPAEALRRERVRQMLMHLPQ